MILKTSTHGNDLTIGEVQTSTFKIQNNSKLYDILSSKLYTDKVMAPIRELICNAYDAHKMVGTPEKPIQVTVPSYSNRVFKVRDFGPGLSLKDMTDLYTTYGASNKSNSNDFIGCLGLGSKSPFAYTDTFTVISRHKGKQYSFVCSMSAGIPSISKFPEVPADGPSGLEVSFEVQRSDVDTFVRKLRAFGKFFCAPIDTFRDGVNYEHIPACEIDFGDSGITLVPGLETDINVLMGGVLYTCNTPAHNSASPLTKEQYNFVHECLQRAHYHNGFVIKAELGSVDIAASREFCENTARTNNYVLTRLYNYLSTLEAKILSELDAQHLPKLVYLREWKNKLEEFHFLADTNFMQECRKLISSEGFSPYTKDQTQQILVQF